MAEKLTMLIAIGFIITGYAQAQVAAVKGNVLYGAATSTPNIGVEVMINRFTTLDIGAGYNPWNLKGSDANNKKSVHWLVSPELRFWLSQKFSQSFFGIHLIGSQFNVGGKNVPLLFKSKYRYQGYAWGGGISYGYHYAISRRWGAELEIGLGAANLTYDKYDCPKCGSKVGHENRTFLGPTRAGISIIYLFYKNHFILK